MIPLPAIISARSVKPGCLLGGWSSGLITLFAYVHALMVGGCGPEPQVGPVRVHTKATTAQKIRALGQDMARVAIVIGVFAGLLAARSRLQKGSAPSARSFVYVCGPHLTDADVRALRLMLSPENADNQRPPCSSFAVGGQPASKKPQGFWHFRHRRMRMSTRSIVVLAAIPLLI